MPLLISCRCPDWTCYSGGVFFFLVIDDRSMRLLLQKEVLSPLLMLPTSPSSPFTMLSSPLTLIPVRTQIHFGKILEEKQLSPKAGMKLRAHQAPALRSGVGALLVPSATPASVW